MAISRSGLFYFINSYTSLTTQKIYGTGREEVKVGQKKEDEKCLEKDNERENVQYGLFKTGEICVFAISFRIIRYVKDILGASLKGE